MRDKRVVYLRMTAYGDLLPNEMDGELGQESQACRIRSRERDSDGRYAACEFLTAWVLGEIKAHTQTLFAFPSIASEISSIVLVENSSKLRGVQQERLDPRLKGKQVDLTWVDKIDDIVECKSFADTLCGS
jgi:hypothetical protein